MLCCAARRRSVSTATYREWDSRTPETPSTAVQIAAEILAVNEAARNVYPIATPQLVEKDLCVCGGVGEWGGGGQKDQIH